MIELHLPAPPSVNAMYRNVAKRGRVKTDSYKEWIRKADALYLTQKRKLSPISGPFKASITLPKVRGDIDNRIKAVLDFLVSRGITDDDKHCVGVGVEVSSELKDVCVVRLAKGQAA